MAVTIQAGPAAALGAVEVACPHHAMPAGREQRRRRQAPGLREQRAGILIGAEARDHQHVGTLEGAMGLAHSPRRQQAAAAPGILGVDQHQIEIANQSPVRESVVHQHQFLPAAAARAASSCFGAPESTRSRPSASTYWHSSSPKPSGPGR